MSLLVAVPCAVAAAIAYGVSTAVEHAVAHESGDAASGGGLLRLVRNPRWLAGIAGDTVGLVLHVIALSTGPVLLIQPLLILALPISLPVARRLGGPAPGWPQYRACILVIVGLGAFFVIVRNPGGADRLHTQAAVVMLVVVTLVGLSALAAVHGRGNAVRAAVYGAVAGAWFGLVAVLMDATATAWRFGRLGAFAHPAGLVPLIGLIVLGAASLALTQLAFQIGALGASLPANLAADPVVAVVLGALVLHENLPMAPLELVAYALCFAAILYGAISLAARPTPA
jgi:hypothetical protein